LALAATKPALDELEITLIGPGRGECCIIHLGSDRWVIVDSCTDNRTNVPAALGYLTSIDANFDSVELIVATHWHDDHISGLAETLRACSKARFCTSSALGSDEFLATVAPYKDRLQFAGGSGAAEIFEVLEELRASHRTPAVRAVQDRRLVQIAADQFAHNFDCEIWSLSPSDAQLQAFYLEIAALIPQIKDTQRRLPSQNKNHMSVVTFVRVGPFSALLGGDLQVTRNPDTGWQPIVRSTGRPASRSTVFKIPHHGSINGHHDEVWTSMLQNRPISIGTPYNGGVKPIPSPQDEARISSLSADFFVTAPAQSGKLRRLPKAVEKTITEQGVTLRPSEAKTGAIRLRNKGLRNPSVFSVELDGLAYRVV